MGTNFDKWKKIFQDKDQLRSIVLFLFSTLCEWLFGHCEYAIPLMKPKNLSVLTVYSFIQLLSFDSVERGTCYKIFFFAYIIEKEHKEWIV